MSRTPWRLAVPDRRFATLLLVLAVLAVVTGCGGSSHMSSSNAASTPTAASTTAGSSSASGNQVALPKKTIAIVNVNNAGLATDVQDAALEAGKALGWSTTTCDGKGDPAQMNACVQSAVSAGVDAIVTIAVDPAAIGSGLRAAKAKNIPVINTSGIGSSSPLVSASYVPNDYAMATLLGKYLVDRGGANGAQIGELSSNIVLSLSLRSDILRLMIKPFPQNKIVATHAIDLANAAQDTQKAVSDMLAAHPNLTTIWVAYDIATVPAIQAVRRAGMEKKVAILSFFCDKSILEAAKQGPPFVACTQDYPVQTEWVAFDALAAHFAKNAPFSLTAADRYDPGVALVDSSSLPAESTFGDFVKYPVNSDWPGLFRKKWQSEYKIGQ